MNKIQIKADAILKMLEAKGYKVRLVSPNNPENPRQWYSATIKNMNVKEWRIDAEKPPLDLTVFSNETANLSYLIPLSSIASKHGIELNDEYSISISFWGHQEGIEQFPLSKLDEIELTKKTEWDNRVKAFITELTKEAFG